MLQAKSLKKHFGGVKAVDGCTFSVQEGKITALIGPNGAGKSTVFNLISGILKADSGKILFQSKEITNQKPHKISNLGISRMFQQSRLFGNLTVDENLQLAVSNDDTNLLKNIVSPGKVISKENQKRMQEALEMVGMGSFKEKFARDLSYGQKRLVELARTILNPHKLLVLDEPVAGVTPALRNEIAKILKSLKKNGETVLVIEHDMNFTFGIADNVIVMDEGKVIAEGPPSKVKNNPKVLEAYLGE